MFLRRGMPPFIVDATMVDPHEFMRMPSSFYRPELAACSSEVRLPVSIQ